MAGDRRHAGMRDAPTRSGGTVDAADAADAAVMVMARSDAARAALAASDWQRCGAADACTGAAVGAAGSPCLFHASPDVRTAYLASSDPIDLRGTDIDRALFGSLADVLRAGGGLVNREVDCTAALFDCEVVLASVTFGRPVSFALATFARRVSLAGVTFAEAARFDQAVFACTTGPRVNGRTEAATRFLDCAFRARTRFGLSVFAGTTSFARSTFVQHVIFEGASFAANVRFDRATFERTRSLELMDVKGTCHLDFATFDRLVTLSIGVGRLNCGGTQFRDGVTIRVARGDLVIEHSDLGPASTVSRHQIAGIREAVDDIALTGLAPPSETGLPAPMPRLISLRGSSIRDFGVSGVDLRPCLFAGAHGLEGLRLDSTVVLGSPPASGSLAPPRRWTRRDVIAEEHRWRAASGHWSEWDLGPEYALPEMLRGVGSVTAMEVADIYRALRVGRESKRDEPGAEDFYYGEMEMRRQSSREVSRPRRRMHERGLIWCYWAVSGYALRPLRSLIALSVVIGAFSTLTATLGVKGRESYANALLATLQSASLRNGTDIGLNDVGRWLQLPLRLLGPLLFGLILLSLRGRVRR